MHTNAYMHTKTLLIDKDNHIIYTHRSMRLSFTKTYEKKYENITVANINNHTAINLNARY